MPYGTTAINGISLKINDEFWTSDKWGAVPIGASCSAKVWVSVRMSAPEADTLTLSVHALRPDASVAFDNAYDVVLSPGDGTSIDIEGFTVDVAGAWTIRVSLDSTIDGHIQTQDLAITVVDGEAGGEHVAYQPCQYCNAPLKIIYQEKSGFIGPYSYFDCPACGQSNTVSRSWDVVSVTVMPRPPAGIIPIIAIAGVLTVIVVAAGKHKG